MKPAPFTYHRPETLAEALDVLGQVGAHGKVLAGGQSLLPVLSMRLAAPEHVVDVNRLAELAFVRSDPAEGVTVGALARHAAVHRDEAAARVQPLLREALGLVAHPVIRNRGTTVGSLAHADPSGEMTAVLALLGGTVELASVAGRRTCAAADFFLGPLESDVRPGELAVSAWFPALGVRAGTAFEEIARRHGDYAMAGAAALVELDASGSGISSARVAYLSMAPTPVVVDVSAAAPGVSDASSETAWGGAVDGAVAQLEPEGDIHATADYRLHLARVLTGRALVRAAGRALERSQRQREQA
ncbi:MAG TPA: FAD binding domain-containing protein [Motilibacteraceae bacterium]|nr:FAD binding domain-containing protein [Motilibacteraceae bacterium]